MNTCETCKWCERGICHRIKNDEVGKREQPKYWYCSEHSAYQRDRDRLEIAKAALAGLLADYKAPLLQRAY